jgi:hypothetical protein
MDLGTIQQGQELPLAVHARTATGLPDLPADNPVASVHRPDGTLVARVRMGCDQQGVVTGFFRHPLFLGAGFETAGLYSVSYSWEDSLGNACGSVGQFLLRPGGDEEGAVIALQAARRPHATYLIRQSDSATISRGKNPR